MAKADDLTSGLYRDRRMTVLKSFAKINLGLEVTGKRPDGYHNLETIFQGVDLFDTIAVEENRSGRLCLSGSDPAIAWDETNTIARAFAWVYRDFDVSLGFDVRVEKEIPPGSGLGGGSSNAAVILLFLNDRLGLGLTGDDLLSAARQIGADVPYFLVGGTVRASGIGDQLLSLPDLQECSVGIVVPPVRVSTALIFSHLRLTTRPITSKIDTFIESRDFTILENGLEKVTFKLFPEVGAIKEKMLRSMACSLVLMSGSGSSVYCLADNLDISRLKDLFPGFTCRVVKTLTRQEYFKRIGASPSGKAPAFGAGIRRFESFRPSLNNHVR